VALVGSVGLVGRRVAVRVLARVVAVGAELVAVVGRASRRSGWT